MKKSSLAPWAVLLLTLAGCLAMAWVETILRPPYLAKSALKWAIFGGFAGLCALRLRGAAPFQALRRPRPGTLGPAALLAGGTALAILGGYALLSPWLDLSAVTGSLEAKEGITAATFPLAALYITLGNSLLEEFFFRGFAFLALRRAGWERAAWGFSALAFALYHVSILDGWFHPGLLLLLVAALGAAGLLFNWLDREGTLWPAWLVHMAANLAVNTIGLRLFGIL